MICTQLHHRLEIHLDDQSENIDKKTGQTVLAAISLMTWALKIVWLNRTNRVPLNLRVPLSLRVPLNLPQPTNTNRQKQWVEWIRCMAEGGTNDGKKINKTFQPLWIPRTTLVSNITTISYTCRPHQLPVKARPI